MAARRPQPPSVANATLQRLVEDEIGAGPIGWVVEAGAGATDLLVRRNPERKLERAVIQAINEDVALAMLLAMLGKTVPVSMWTAAHERAVRATVVDQVPLDRAIANVRAIQQFWIRAIRDHALASKAQPEIHQKIVIIVTSLMDQLLDLQIKMYLSERGDLSDSTSAHRHRLVEDLVGGRVVGEHPREALGLDLDDQHIAVVLTAGADSLSGVDALHLTAMDLKEHLRCRSFLLHESEQQTFWIWASHSGRAPDVATALEKVVASTAIRAGIGSSRAGIAGFRRSHLEAMRAVRMAQAGSVGNVVRYRDVALASLVHCDAEWAEWFVEDYLGALADPRPATRELRKTLQLFYRCQMRLAPAARELGIHRNTLIARLQRIETLLGHSPAENLPEIMCAMLILNLADPSETAGAGRGVRENRRVSAALATE